MQQTEFDKLIALVNNKISTLRKELPEDQVNLFDQVCADLYGIISVYDNWLNNQSSYIDELEAKGKPQKEKRIVTLN